MTTAPLVEFTAAGAAKSIAEDIEQCARIDNILSAIVVPWESSAGLLSIAVTLVKIDGWAIEHTNLGTITVADLGNALSRVAILAVDADHPDQDKRLKMLFRFVSQIQDRLTIVANDDEPAGR